MQSLEQIEEQIETLPKGRYIEIVENLIYMKNKEFSKKIKTLSNEQLKVITKDLKKELQIRNLIK